MITDKTEYDEAVNEIKNEIKDEVDRFKTEQRKLGKSEDQIEIDLHGHMRDFISNGNPSIRERLDGVRLWGHRPVTP